MGIALICPQLDFSSYKHTVQLHPVVDVKPTAIRIKGSDTLDNTSNQAKYSISFTPFNSTYRNTIWAITDGSDYATISKNGLLTAKYYAADPSNAHDVTITATNARFTTLTATKTVSVMCNVVDGAITIDGLEGDNLLYSNGKSFIIQGLLAGEASALVRFKQPVSMDTTASYPSTIADKVTLVDNMDGTATVTLLTSDYLHQVKFEAYNDAVTSTIGNVTVNFNDSVIINSADSANSAELMSVFYGNGNCADASKMYQSEAYVITSI